MYLYQRIFRAIQEWLHPSPRSSFSLEVDTLRMLKRVAKEERRSPEALAKQLIDDELRYQQLQQENGQIWQSLTPREKQVTALICLHYTSRQIGVFLGISQVTVKTHAGNAMEKFEVPNRDVLRARLQGWDFSEWDR